MATRTTLPWDTIYQEARTGVIDLAKRDGRPFVISVRYLADYMYARPDTYPTITCANSVKVVRSRCTMAFDRFGWKRWTTGNRNGGAMKFVVPWASEDKTVLVIRE